MADTNLPAEPADKSFAVWFDQNGDPYAIFYRDGFYAIKSNTSQRWMDADQRVESDVEMFTWADLCAEMEGFDGPHMLTLVRSESPAVKP